MDAKDLVKRINDNMGSQRSEKFPGVDFNARPPVWVAVLNGDSEDYEISVCRTDEPHGFISWGWDGPKKVILREGSDDDEKIIPGLFKFSMAFAERMAAHLNGTLPTLPDAP